MMSWIFLLLAGAFEIAFTTALKKSNGFSFERPQYIVVFTFFALTSFGFLNLALRGISLSTAYAVWTGIGVGGTILVGMLWFDESLNGLQMFFLGTLFVSIVGLKLVS